MSRDVDTLHAMMLDAISDRYKKKPGYPAWDFTRAFAIAAASLSEDVDAAEAHTDVYQLTGQALDIYITQRRGIQRKYAEYATAELTVTGGSGTVYSGDLFATDENVQFYAIADTVVSAGSEITVRAVEGGTGGNVPADTIVRMPVTLSGITGVTNLLPASGGADAESDDDYRTRFIADLQTPNNGANRAAYLAWATSVPGVGRAKVFPLAFGANTVEVCITDSAMEAATTALINSVQAYIDPDEDGSGNGAAPIGAACTVTSCTELTVNVAYTLVVESGVSRDTVIAAIHGAIEAYLKSIAFISDYVSYAKIGNCINDTPGVYDYSALTINAGTSNITIGVRQVPVLGTVMPT